MSEQSKSFKEAMDRLDAIVTALNQNDIELEKAMALFVEGSQLAADCQKQLNAFDEQIKAVKESLHE